MTIASRPPFIDRLSLPEGTEARQLLLVRETAGELVRKSNSEDLYWEDVRRRFRFFAAPGLSEKLLGGSKSS